MTRHYNPTIASRTSRLFNTKAGDNFSDDVTGLVATVPVEATVDYVRNNSSTSSATTTLTTTPTGVDTYLTSVLLVATADATSDCTLYVMNATINGSSRRIAEIRKQTTTAESSRLVVNFPGKGLRVDPNTTITIVQTFTVGNSTISGIVYGYQEEINKP